MNLDQAGLVFVTFAYPLLVAVNLIYAAVRLFRYWQVQREKWLLWKAVANLGEAVAFFLFSAFTSVFPRSDPLLLRPYARFAWVLVLIPLGIALIGEMRDLHVIMRKRTVAIKKSETQLFYRGNYEKSVAQ